ncbi:MAG: GNAT family N-acetyltransferase [Rickettsiales bacterium]|jgi:GNAT superfamily N-acetyltransferase|nr:GNAT family N-acetyltransferase [Rickettsiales bacterium]
MESNATHFITIRRAESRDFKAVQEVQLSGGDALLTMNDAIPIPDMEIQASDPRGIFGVAESGGIVVGFIYGEKLTARWALASYFAVRPDFRGSDAWRKLAVYFADECKKHDVKYIVSYADSGNQKLINFYKHLGFDTGGTYIEMIKEI